MRLDPSPTRLAEASGQSAISDQSCHLVRQFDLALFAQRIKEARFSVGQGSPCVFRTMASEAR
jgi:hypothetical protein